MDTRLIERMESVGRHVVRLPLTNGAEALVLPCSGRLLGLYAANSDENFLWNNDALQSKERAAKLFDSGGWPNPGGDRTWLAPELELFIGDPTRAFETYAVPPDLDPGHWNVVNATDEDVRLANATTLHLKQSGLDVNLQIGKQYGSAANPLSDTALADQVQYAGYTQVTSLALTPNSDHCVRLGIWNLLQLPQPGTMLIAIKGSTQHHVVFGAATAEELTVTPPLLRWCMAAPGGDTKISFKAHSLIGRAGYLHETGTPGIHDLVVREFAVGAERDYVDALWEPPYEAGWTFQACCVRNGPDRFNELEYHVPAATTEAGKNICQDESRVWAFRGTKGAIAGVTRHLLGDPVIG